MARNASVNVMIDQIQVLTQDPDFLLAEEVMYGQILAQHFARLYALYVKAEPDRYRSEETLTIGVDPLIVSSDWLLTIGVDFLLPGNRREPLVRLQEQDHTRFFNQTGQARAYRIIDETIELFPTPQNGQKYVHIWIPTAPNLGLGDSTDCRLGHERYLVLCTARDLLNAENTYDGRWDAEIKKIEDDLTLEANYRYFHDMARMTSDYQQRYKHWPFAYPYGVRW